ncbi:NAD-dependent epimerase/dehydratase family protein [Fictibacillus fluitans]|uniref:NAD(P)-dependent oxidoreductase n=1 Tax=Fictibacillus fluitans TaxID=3058422 RepID=A0ABT8HWM6_9BACL|nr:NAD(P)-dependent oxidoreductase [Fictibacillus sp. NE201]MDN4525183.1 NAD(P)-dependent oxidoreductase [Fictibacillus sp. NE201]
MRRVAITGGSGNLGRWVLRDLMDRGYEVINIDQKQPEGIKCKTIIVDLNNLGEVYGALQNADAVIHLAAINSPGGYPNEVVFKNNVLSTFNILEATARLRIPKVVCASSESIYGWAWAKHTITPNYFPIDEQHPLLPQECYGLSKIVMENTAETFYRENKHQILCLRFAHIAVPPHGYEYLCIDSSKHKFLWSYVDVRDAAVACRLAIETDGLGFSTMNITADDTCMVETSIELVKKYYPLTKDVRADLSGHQALSSNGKAKKLLNWHPKHSWREYTSIETT